MWFHYILLGTQALFAIFVIYLTVRMLFVRLPSKGTDKSGPVSIVIPFRNEAENLPALLESLINQDYKEGYEILLINDLSDDNYHDIIEKFKTTHPHIPLKCITTQFNESVNLTSKQQALECGVSNASYNWIAFTDADMILERNWLSILIGSASDICSVTYGHTIIEKYNKSIFYSLQAFQLEFLFITAYAFNSAGLRGSCMGNNMLVSKEVYNSLGGQAGIGYSIVEDRDLLNKAINKGYHGSASTPFSPTARTYPCKTIAQFFHQSLRWIKGGARTSLNLLPAIVLFGAQNIIFLLSLCMVLPPSVVWCSILNFIMLGIFIRVGILKTGSQENILFYPVFYLFCILETVIMVFPALFMAPIWKQRKI